MSSSSFAQFQPDRRDGQRQRGGGFGPGGCDPRVQFCGPPPAPPQQPPKIDNTPALHQLVLQLTQKVMAGTGNKSPERQTQLSTLIASLNQCPMLRDEFIASCISDSANRIVDISLQALYEDPSGVGRKCYGTISSNAWLANDQGEAFPDGHQYAQVLAGNRFELARPGKLSYESGAAVKTTTVGFYIHMLDGESAGKYGYLSQVYVNFDSCKF